MTGAEFPWCPIISGHFAPWEEEELGQGLGREKNLARGSVERRTWLEEEELGQRQRQFSVESLTETGCTGQSARRDVPDCV